MHKQANSLLNNGTFRKILLIQALSHTASAVTTFALPLVLYGLTHKGSVVALVTMLATLPYFCFGFLAGMAADVFDRKKLMLVANLGRTIGSLLLVIMFAFGQVSILVIGIIIFINGTFHALHSTVLSSIIPELIAKDMINRANSIIYSAINVVNILGPIVAGMALCRIGVANIFVIEMVMFLGTLLITYNLATQPGKVTLKPVKGIWTVTGIVNEFKMACSWHNTKIYLILALLVNLFGSNLAHFVMLFTKANFQIDANALGSLLGACGVGSLLGSIAYAKIFYNSSLQKLCILLLLDALFRQILPFTSSVIVIALVMIQTYFIMSLISIFIISERQRSMPNELLGKATSLFRTVALGSRPLASLMAGIVMTFFSIKNAFIISNACYALAVIYILLQLKHQLE